MVRTACSSALHSQYYQYVPTLLDFKYYILGRRALGQPPPQSEVWRVTGKKCLLESESGGVGMVENEHVRCTVADGKLQVSYLFGTTVPAPVEQLGCSVLSGHAYR